LEEIRLKRWTGARVLFRYTPGREYSVRQIDIVEFTRQSGASRARIEIDAYGIY